jgi:hypothetical protein
MFTVNAVNKNERADYQFIVNCNSGKIVSLKFSDIPSGSIITNAIVLKLYFFNAGSPLGDPAGTGKFNTLPPAVGLGFSLGASFLLLLFCIYDFKFTLKH